MSDPSSESGPRSPASDVTSFTSTESNDSPLSPDREFSQRFPLPEDRLYTPDDTPPPEDEEARFRGRAAGALHQGSPFQPPPPPPPPGPDPPAEDPPALSENPTLEEIRTHNRIPTHRPGAGMSVVAANLLPNPPRTPPPQEAPDNL